MLSYVQDAENGAWVCDRCQKLDLQTLLSQIDISTMPTSGGKGIFICNIAKLKLGEKVELQSDCTLCNTLFRGLYYHGNVWNRPSVVWELRACAITTIPRFSNESLILDTHTIPAVIPCLVITLESRAPDMIVLPARNLIMWYQCHSPCRVLMPTSIPKAYNPKFALDCIKRCVAHHSSSCNIQTAAVEGLRLFDCNELRVIPQPLNAQYVALSYVWAKTAPVPLVSGMMIADLSQTIKDAITVTLSLGYSYLWVDKLCISQEDEDSKLIQVLQMDKIYSGASITIIAAAGRDETHGIAGVSIHRKVQEPVKLGNTTIITAPVDYHDDYRQSHWNTRGWTYQEAVLSTRRLVFTEKQMVFECNAMTCPEAVYSRSRDEGERKRIPSTPQSFLFNSHIRLVPVLKRICDRWYSYDEMARDFTARNLTYESDSFRAFFGITSEFSRAPSSIKNLCGIPFGLQSDWPSIKHARHVTVAWGLSWSHRTTQPENLEAIGAPTRRLSFPSWTWAGWCGAIEYRTAFHTKTRSILQMTDWKWNEITDTKTELYGSMMEPDSHYLSTIESLHLNTLIFPAMDMELIIPPRTENVKIEGYRGRLMLSTHIDVGVAVKKLQANEWSILGLYYSGLAGKTWRLCMMIVEPVPKGFSRIGILNVDIDDHPNVTFLRHSKAVRRAVVLV